MNGFQIKSTPPMQDKLHITRSFLAGSSRITLWFLYQVRDDFRLAVM